MSWGRGIPYRGVSGWPWGVAPLVSPPPPSVRGFVSRRAGCASVRVESGTVLRLCAHSGHALPPRRCRSLHARCPSPAADATGATDHGRRVRARPLLKAGGGGSARGWRALGAPCAGLALRGGVRAGRRGCRRRGAGVGARPWAHGSPRGGAARAGRLPPQRVVRRRARTVTPRREEAAAAGATRGAAAATTVGGGGRRGKKG